MTHQAAAPDRPGNLRSDRSFYCSTLGCRVNQYETESLAGQLAADGWRQTRRPEQARVIIVNTCTVTGRASMQSRQELRRLIRINPHARVVAVGCYAQTEPEALRELDGIDCVVGNSDKHRVASMVAELVDRAADLPATQVRPVGSNLPFQPFPPQICGNRSRPFLKIQDGCNQFCTYCIVPRARGRSRSMAPEDVLRHMAQFVRQGRSEVVLTGIHLGCYGMDLTPLHSLETLLAQIDQMQPALRVRLSSIEPHELTPAIIDQIAHSRFFCRHFHIPLQSGDDDILQRMHRPYQAALFKQRAQLIRRLMPDAAIGADIIVGFPGETETAFERTLALVTDAPLTYLHVFPFSPRQGTPAAKMRPQTPASVCKTRCRRLRDLGMSKKHAFYRRFVGRDLEIVVERQRDRRHGLLKGVSDNYIPVLLDGPDDLKNHRVRVRIDRIDGHHNLWASVLAD